MRAPYKADGIVAEGGTDRRKATSGSWFPVARGDFYRIIAAPHSCRHSAALVWSELLQFANFKRSLKFELSQIAIADRLHMGRRTVGDAVALLASLELLTWTSPKGKGGKNVSSKFHLKPSVSPVKAEGSCANSAHEPCAKKSRHNLRTDKQGGLKDPPCKKKEIPPASLGLTAGAHEAPCGGPEPEKQQPSFGEGWE